MSDDSAYRLAKMLFGLDRGELDVALDNLNERYFQPIAQVAIVRSYCTGIECARSEDCVGSRDTEL